MRTLIAVAVPGQLERYADEELPLASVGKLLLLAEFAHAIVAGEVDRHEQISIWPGEYCAGSGLLADLSPRTWTVADLILLTAAVSDNTATNALLRRIGIERVNARAEALGLRKTHILDRIREPRLPEHAPTFARGTARDLATLADLVAGPEPWARLMLGWMASNTDRSMVAAGIPHEAEEREIPKCGAVRNRPWVANKTGTDAGIRADVGVVRGARQVTYAAIGRSAPGGEDELVLEMRELGGQIAAWAG